MTYFPVRAEKAVIEAARQYFIHGPAYRKSDCSFDEYLRLFGEKRTMVDIAKDLRLSTQSVSNTYRRHFVPLFGVSGHARRSMIERQSTPAYNGLARLVAEEAVLHSCTPKPVLHASSFGRTRNYERLISINERMCHIMEVTKLQQNRYMRIAITAKTFAKANILIVILRLSGEQNRFFIFPSDLIEKITGNTKSLIISQRTVYVPLFSRSTGQGHLMNYEGLWELFKILPNQQS